jgi:type IX secretion system PorP/SprF family membrane protein
MKTLFFILFYLMTSSLAFSQQTPQLTMRGSDPLIFNPAIAGSNRYPEIKLHHRSQWVGYNGAPTTSLISYHNELSTKMGVGGYIANDAIGAINQFSLNLSYAYHLSLKKFFLAFGLSAKISQLSLKGSDLLIYENDDNSIAGNFSDKKFFPDANFGMLAYNSKFFMGISVMQLLGRTISLSDLKTTANLTMQQHYMLSAGYTKKLNKTYSVESSFWLNTTNGAPAQFELNCKLDYTNKFLTGLSYRSNDALALMVGVRYKRYMISYSYDIVTSKLRTASSGSHEILIALNWPFTPDIKPLYDLKGSDRGQIKKRIY